MYNKQVIKEAGIHPAVAGTFPPVIRLPESAAEIPKRSVRKMRNEQPQTAETLHCQIGPAEYQVRNVFPEFASPEEASKAAQAALDALYRIFEKYATSPSP